MPAACRPRGRVTARLRGDSVDSPAGPVHFSGAGLDARAPADHDSPAATSSQLFPARRAAVREVLIIRFGALGDLVLATVLLDALGAGRSHVRITWVTKQRWGALLARDERVDELVLLREGESVRELARRLPRQYDLVIDAQANLRSRLLCFLVNSGQTRRLAKDGFARWIYRHGAPRPRALDRRLIDRYLALLDDPLPSRPDIRTTDPAPDRTQIAVAIGATHDTKRWPIERFAELVARLAGEGYEVSVIGGPGEEQLVQLAAAESGAAWDSRRPLDELADHLQSCVALVGNDSGLLHLAEAVGTPVLGIFGPTVEAWGYAPWQDRSRMLEQDLDCRPCSKMGEKPCRLPEKLCLTRTTVQDVLAALEELVHERA
ncbi:hypothetical protein DRQ32_02505 [bacterium]|nr:MAG: hypothetical protein DRQ32_02505 [bacterium]